MGAQERESWYVLRTKPRAEELASHHLRERRIGVFLPLLAPADRPGLRVGLRCNRPEPLFPGYLFVRLELARDYLTAAWTPGVRDFLKLGEAMPQAIDDAVVACLHSRVDEHGVVRRDRRFQVGDRVEVTQGPFAGLLAVIDRPCSARGRIHVLLDLLRRRTRLELPVSVVAPA